MKAIGRNRKEESETSSAAMVANPALVSNSLEKQHPLTSTVEISETESPVNPVNSYNVAPVVQLGGLIGESGISRASSPAATLPNPHDGYVFREHVADMNLNSLRFDRPYYLGQSGWEVPEAQHRNAFEIHDGRGDLKEHDLLSFPVVGPPPAYRNNPQL